MNLPFKRLLGVALTLCYAIAAAQATNPPQRLRGTVETFDGNTLVLKERSGEVLRLVLDEKFSVNEVVPIELSSIQPNSYVGIASMPQSDGSLRALEGCSSPKPRAVPARATPLGTCSPAAR